MLFILRAALVVLVVLMTRCLTPVTFLCQTDAECVKDGVHGKCIRKACSFPETSCASGSRWDTTAQDKAGECLCSPDPCPPTGNATAADCMAGTCEIASCADGYRDCDGKYANGCEANVTNSDMQVDSAIDHCGACGKGCLVSDYYGSGTSFLPYYATGTSCQMSACRITMCEAGHLDCDGQFDNGCECELRYCSGSTCTNMPPSCHDGVQDGDETDVDCGGSCDGCGFGKHCADITGLECQLPYVCYPDHICR